MLLRFLFILFFSFSFSSLAYKINNSDFTEESFYSFVSKSEWDALPSKQKKDLLKDYIYKKLVFLETSTNGFLDDPYFSRKLKNRLDQFLINVAYDLYVAYPLVDSVLYQKTLKNLKTDINVSHLLFGYKGCRLPIPFNRTKENTEAYANNIYKELVAGASFDEYVLKYSDDPSAKKNNGNIGWLSWGRTVPEFQSVAFSLDVNSISKPILTDFGFHIIRLEEKRNSQASLLDSLSYIALCTEKAISGVPLDKKRLAAEKYDLKTVVESGLVFNNNSLLAIYEHIVKENKKNRIVASGKKNLIKILSSIESSGVVCVFEKKGYGVKWFANHFSRLPSTRIPSIESVEDLKKSFKLAVLQQLSLNKIYSDLNKFDYLLGPKTEKISENLIYDSFLKYTINNLENISDSKIKNYYEKNKDSSYVEFDLVEIREIKTLNKSLSDSLYSLLLSGSSFLDIASSFSLTNPRNSGLIEPFTKNRYGPMGKAAFNLTPGSFSNQIENLDGTWSIVFLEKFIDKQFVPLKRVENKIKSLLKKEQQENIKNSLYDSLFVKYSVWINPDFLILDN